MFKFQLSNFTLTWSNEGKVNSVRPYMTYSKELQQKMKILDKVIFKNIWIKPILVKYCATAVSRNNNRFLMGIKRSLSQKRIMKI